MPSPETDASADASIVVDASITMIDAPIDVSHIDAACQLCAGGVQLVDDATGMARGGDGGSTFSDQCPPMEAVIGYHGSTNNGNIVVDGGVEPVVSSLQPICGLLQLVKSTDTTVTVFPGTTLSRRGNLDTNDQWDALCGDNRVVVGVVGGSGNLIDQVQFQCAHLLVGTAQDGSTTVVPDMSTVGKTDPHGGDKGTSFAVPCPSGQLANGNFGRAGSYVDSLGLICVTPKMVGPAPGQCCNSPLATAPTDARGTGPGD